MSGCPHRRRQPGPARTTRQEFVRALAAHIWARPARPRPAARPHIVLMVAAFAAAGAVAAGTVLQLLYPIRLPRAAAQTGRSTALRTVMMAGMFTHTPEEMQFYVQPPADPAAERTVTLLPEPLWLCPGGGLVSAGDPSGAVFGLHGGAPDGPVVEVLEHVFWVRGAGEPMAVHRQLVGRLRADGPIFAIGAPCLAVGPAMVSLAAAVSAGVLPEVRPGAEMLIVGNASSSARQELAHIAQAAGINIAE